MTEITINSRLIICCILVLLWFFTLGMYMQLNYDILHIEIPDNALYCVLGLILGAITVHLYYLYKG